VHRLISDLSVLIGQQSRHRIIVAGDLNILHGYGEDGSQYWASRYQTVFDRMEALGLPFIGPQSPDGRQASPWPEELPKGSRNVPTFHSNRQAPETATRQLDFVFAWAGLRGRVKTRALNEPLTWGPSDHCPVEIAVE
jgi:endonuclease/exonuclease/phosphatase family metal-dependent hydrolase